MVKVLISFLGIHLYRNSIIIANLYVYCMHFSATEIRKMLLLGGAHYVLELKLFVRVSLLRARANRMVGGAHYVHNCL